MNTAWKTILVTALSTMCMAFGGHAQDGTLTVLVLDYAGLSGSSLNEMESLSGLLLSRAGIRTEWVHCLGHQTGPRPALCDKKLEPGSAQIRILKTRTGGKNGLGDPVGSAMVGSGYASVYACEISKYAEHNELPADSLMAYATTHEIGHLLLGMNHEPTGIMRAVWGKAELREIARGSLRFSRPERQALRHAFAAWGQPVESLK
jgi:hypothetical protein